MSRISLDHVSVRRGTRAVIDDVSFEVAPGAFVGLLGPNGAGKTTLIRALMGELAATGDISVAGRPHGSLSAGERARLIAYLPQEREIAWAVSVEFLVMLGRAPYRRPFASPTAIDRERVVEAMQRCDVVQFRNRSIHQLSTGEQARVMIARALAQDTDIILADEPAAGLDPAHQIALMQTFAALAGEGRTILTSLHELGLAARWCNRLILLNGGRIVADGPPEQVVTQEILARVYGIDAFVGRDAGGLIVVPTGARECVT